MTWCKITLWLEHGDWTGGGKVDEKGWLGYFSSSH